MEEIYALPASEIAGWINFFNIYPFTQDREDERSAMLASLIVNSSGKIVKTPVLPAEFIPNYFGTAPEVSPEAAEMHLDILRMALTAKAKAT